MDISEALKQLSVTDDTLSTKHKKQLDDAGYLIVENVLNNQQLHQFGGCLDELYEREGHDAGLEISQEVGCPRLTNLINKNPMFDVCFSSPLLLAATFHILKYPFKTNSLNYRDVLVGYGLQRLHPDHERSVQPGEYIKCNSIWLIDSYTGNNGSSRLVPKSHRSGQHPREAMDNHYDRHPDEVILIAPRGSMIIFNAHVWHGGTCNTSGERRRTLHASFIRRDHDQQLNEKDYIRTETYNRLSPALRFLLDVD